MKLQLAVDKSNEFNIVKSVVYFVFATLFILTSNTVAGTIYTLARAPQQNPLKLVKAWKPFISYINEQTGVKFKLKLYKNRAEFEQQLLAGEPDIVFMSPFYFLLSNETQGYIPLVRSDAKKLKGILVAKLDSPFRTLKDLDGQTLAFPSPNALGASLYVRALLEQNEGIKITPKYVETHDNVYLSVINGKTAAGGGVYRTLKNQKNGLKSKLTILYETPGLAPHPLAAHPRVPAEIRAKLVKAILSLNANGEGRKILAKVKLKTPIVADYERDYKIIKELNLKQYSTFK